MGIVTVVANFLQHFYFGIMGEKMTERVRRMMFSGADVYFLESPVTALIYYN
jgi:ATP-binding cassette subfamily B (MDR/TAP) protein 1